MRSRHLDQPAGWQSQAEVLMAQPPRVPGEKATPARTLLSVWGGLALLSPLLAGILGCGGSLQEGFEQELTSSGGCADITLYARNDDDTIAMIFSSPGLSEQAHASGSLLEVTWSFPSDAMTLKVRTGTHVSDTTCDDVAEGSDVRATYVATAGQASIQVDPDQPETDYGSYPGHASVSLTDVVLTNEDDPSDEVPLTAFAWADVYVGWFPG